MTAARSLRLVPVANHALTPAEPLAVLARLCADLQARRIVEVGTFLGRGTTLVFGEATKDGGELVCVDNCVVDMAVRRGIHRPESHLHLLLSNLAQHPATVHAQLLRAASREAAGIYAGPADLVFIDAGHGYNEVKTDIDAWRPHVRPGGILCGDDYAMEGVARAVDEAFAGQVRVDDRIWWVPL